jgi:hypothetical protein
MDTPRLLKTLRKLFWLTGTTMRGTGSQLVHVLLPMMAEEEETGPSLSGSCPLPCTFGVSGFIELYLKGLFHFA